MLWNSKNFLVHSIELDIFAQHMCFSKFRSLALSCSAAEVLTSFVVLHWWSAIASFQYSRLKDDGHDLWLCRLWKQSVMRISPKMSKYTNWIYDLFYLRSCLIFTENGYLLFICEVVSIVTENRYLLLKIFSHLPWKRSGAQFCMYACSLQALSKIYEMWKGELVDTFSGFI